MNTRTGKTDDVQPLLVETPPPDLSRVWSVVGSFSLILLVFFALFLPSPFTWMATLGMMMLVLVARVVQRVSVPRRHPAAVWAMLALLLPLPFAMQSPFGSGAYPVLLLILAVAWSTLWLIRTEAAIRIAGLGLLTLGAITAMLSWVSPLTPGTSVGGPVTAFALIFLLIGFFPWLLMFRGAYRGSVLGLYTLILAGLFAPVNLRTLAFLPGFQMPLSSPGILMTALLLIVAFLLFRTALKERRRWKRRGALRGLLLATLSLSLVLPFLLVLHGNTASGTVFAVYGAMLGLSLAARERLIYEDPTRHPRSISGPWWAVFEEFWIAIRSLATWLFHRNIGNAVQNVPLPRRILDPSGTKIINPYKDGSPLWVPVVMHLHSNRWEGAFSALDVVSHYTRIGAGSVILTDHNRITRIAHPNAGPAAYEHGWGPHNHHILVLGAEKTIPDAHPFGGSTYDHRRTLARLRPLSRFIILAHPRNGNAWHAEDVTALDYDAVELFNKSADDTSIWDDALTSGLLVWGTAGDDCHDLRSRHQTGKRFLLLDLRGVPGIDEGIPPSPEMVLEALQSGRFVAMRLAEPSDRRRITRRMPEPDAPEIESFRRTGNTLEVHFAKPVEAATIFSDGGAILQRFENCDVVRLAVPEGDSYVRLEVKHGDHLLALNPLARVAESAQLPGLTG